MYITYESGDKIRLEVILADRFSKNGEQLATSSSYITAVLEKEKEGEGEGEREGRKKGLKRIEMEAREREERETK